MSRVPCWLLRKLKGEPWMTPVIQEAISDFDTQWTGIRPTSHSPRAARIPPWIWKLQLRQVWQWEHDPCTCLEKWPPLSAKTILLSQANFRHVPEHWGWETHSPAPLHCPYYLMQEVVLKMSLKGKKVWSWATDQMEIPIQVRPRVWRVQASLNFKEAVLIGYWASRESTEGVSRISWEK